MANKNFFETLTQYRLKIEKDGKSVVNMPGIFALPGMLMAPRLSITGLIAPPILGLKVHLENEGGETVDVEDAVRKAAEAVKDSVATATKTIREEIDKAWEAVSADEPEEGADADASGNTVDGAENGAEENAESHEANETSIDVSNEDIVEELKAHEENDVPTIEVKPDESNKE